MNNFIENGEYEEITINTIINRPVFALISSGLIFITILYVFGVLKELPCGEGPLNGLNRAFVHVDSAHIISNLFVFYILSRIEVTHGAGVFILLIVQITFIATVFELILKELIDIPCSIGFSGVLFGLAVWELLYDKNIDLALLFGVAAMVITPSLHNPRASLIGHGLGAIAGLLVSLYYKPMKKL